MPPVSAYRISSLVRDSLWTVLALAALRFATLLAVPLALLGLGHQAWAFAPLVGGAALELVRLGWRQRLRRRLRAECLRRAAEDALDKAALVPEAQVDSAFWAAHLAEYVVSVDIPAILGAAGAGLAILIWAAFNLGLLPLLGLGALAAVATAFSLLVQRFRNEATDAIVEGRQATASLLAAAERDVGEIYGERARKPFLDQLVRETARWCRAEDGLELRTAFYRLGLALIVISAVWLTVRAQGVDPLTLDRDALLSLQTVSHTLLLGFYVPIVYVFVQHADSAQVSRAEIARLHPALPRPTGAARRLAARPRLVKAEKLEFRYGEHLALDLPALELPLGQPLVLTGSNGSGKTTFGLLLCGVLSPTRGALTVDGTPCAEVDRDQLAFVPQTPLVLEVMSVRQNIELVAPGASPDAMRDKLRELGFDKDLEHRASSLSRGEQRRIAIARALLKQPALVVLDEPDAWLDSAGRARVLDVLQREAEQRAVVIITHRSDLVPARATLLELGADHRVRALSASGESTA
ncbi:MAG TPA: ATP-binding cassette domain-containing protein [Polyangiaceae bacterium]|nr:ATP-binding cassette domain-containing protein [Polyangiaceae bacterium]